MDRKSFTRLPANDRPIGQLETDLTLADIALVRLEGAEGFDNTTFEANDDTPAPLHLQRLARESEVSNRRPHSHGRTRHRRGNGHHFGSKPPKSSRRRCRRAKTDMDQGNMELHGASFLMTGDTVDFIMDQGLTASVSCSRFPQH